MTVDPGKDGALVTARQHAGAAGYVPDGATLDELAAAVRACHGCDLYERATQAVFGRGRQQARVVLIGEQPGDAEDRAGEPFVGPAGRVLDRALREAKIAPQDAYVTNAVKHFRWKPDPRGGKRRIHERPDAGQIRACRPWLEAELACLMPAVVVVLGATAGQALFGSSFRVSQRRGTAIPWSAPAPDGGAAREIAVVATIHPSAVLRATDRDALFAGLVSDLSVAAAVAGQ
jgi:uracil-DNA glycosylase